MIIKTLIENTSNSEVLGCEHGLSLYIETISRRIIFDMGASNLFAENAQKLGVDLNYVDIAILSHDHYDHGGGLKTFLNINSSAKIYLNHETFGLRFTKTQNGEEKYIGLDRKLKADERFHYVDKYLKIDDELVLFSGVKQGELSPTGNKNLYMMKNDSLVYDDFAHEQNLLITENGKTLLIAGCAHKGIVSIIEHIKLKGLPMPTHVIGGFHLYNKSANQFENPDIIQRIGYYLKNTGASFYTCHCTGVKPYEQLKEIMGDSISYLATGDQLTI